MVMSTSLQTVGVKKKKKPISKWQPEIEFSSLNKLKIKGMKYQ